MAEKFTDLLVIEIKALPELVYLIIGEPASFDAALDLRPSLELFAFSGLLKLDLPAATVI